jgi:hypothetical protein
MLIAVTEHDRILLLGFGLACGTFQVDFSSPPSTLTECFATPTYGKLPAEQENQNP